MIKKKNKKDISSETNQEFLVGLLFIAKIKPNFKKLFQSLNFEDLGTSTTHLERVYNIY